MIPLALQRKVLTHCPYRNGPSTIGAGAVAVLADQVVGHMPFHIVVADGVVTGLFRPIA